MKSLKGGPNKEERYDFMPSEKLYRLLSDLFRHIGNNFLSTGVFRRRMKIQMSFQFLKKVTLKNMKIIDQFLFHPSLTHVRTLNFTNNSTILCNEQHEFVQSIVHGHEFSRIGIESFITLSLFLLCI